MALTVICRSHDFPVLSSKTHDDDEDVLEERRHFHFALKSVHCTTTLLFNLPEKIIENGKVNERSIMLKMFHFFQ